MCGSVGENIDDDQTKTVFSHNVDRFHVANLNILDMIVHHVYFDSIPYVGKSFTVHINRSSHLRSLIQVNIISVNTFIPQNLQFINHRL